MAAQDAELKLKVSLDLGFFRQQLAGLGQAAAGYNLPVKVQFDRRSVQNELNALGANIRRRNYRLNIETNLSAEIAKADTLARKLDELGKKIKASAGSAFSKGPQGAAGLEKFMREQGLTGRAFGVQQAQENIARQAILARLEKKALSAGGYNKEGLQKIIRDLGGTPSGKREDLVAQAKKLVQESDGIADAVFENLKDLQMKLRPIRGQAQTSAARSMPNLNQMLDRIANLTENPRAAQRMLRMMPESRLTTDLIGAANKQAAFKEAGPGQFLDLRGKAFDPLLKTIAKDFSDYAKTVNISNPWVGQIGDGIRRIIAVSAQSATSTTKALPPIGGTTSPMSALERRLAQSRGTLGTGGGVAGSLFTGRGPVNPGLSMLSPVGISGGYRQMAAALASQAANPALAHRQIADIGFGGVPTAATGLSGQALNNILNQAFLQRRGLGLGGGQSLPIFNAPGVAVQQNIPGMAYRMGGGGLGGSMGMFPSAGMMGPSRPLTINAQSSMFGGGGMVPPGGGGGGMGGMGGMGGFGRAIGGISLPGSGVIRELGSEFAFATKQVLLFGQAYKMLAFIQDFPAQVGAAVSQLQNFRNTLGAISPTAQEAASSNQLILDLVEKYNVPLQSARDGFTKLYASMAPAGFSGDEIRDLFTGITQAAATFGMSADKVDRVNYAFAQMASKGQVMSEELKGQLGDVLPGAMALFAEAAGFEGPKAIQDFSQALEDGAYKGEAMVALLKNVGIVMKQEFGPGAEGAARTFQGVINRMQNSMVLLYESFEPIAINFLNGVVVPLTSGIKQVSDGFKAFFTGAAAQTTGGFAIAQQLQELRPAFEGITKNVSALISQFGQFAGAALEVGKVLLQIAGNPFVGYVARVYINVLALTTAIQILNLKALIPMIANLARSAYALIAFTAQCARAGQSAQVMGLMVRTAGITLRAFFATTGVGIVLVGIGLLIEKFMSMNQALADTKAKALGAADAIRSMSKTEARAAEQSAQSAYKTIGAIAGRAGSRIQGPGNDRIVEISERELKQLQGVGAFQTARDPLTGRITARRSDILSLAPQAQRLQAQAAGQVRDLTFQEKQAQQQAVLAPIPAAAAEGKGATKEKAKKERESQVPLLELELATTQQMFEIEKQIMAARLGENELEVVRLNGLKEQLRFNEQIAKVKLDNELPAAEKALQIQRLTKEAELARLQTNFDLETKILEAYKKINDTIVDIGKQSALELEDRKEYQRLVMDGILPSTAKITVEVNRQFALEAEKLELLQAQIKDQIAILEAKQNITKEDQNQLDILRQRLKETGANMQELPGLAGETIQSRIQTEGPADPNVSMRENIASLEEEFKRLYSWQNQAVEGSKAIGAALGEAITTGVTGMIAGTATAKEVFASFLQSVGQALSQAASQMIATYIAIGIAKMFAGLGGGGNSGGSGGGISDILPEARQYMGGADVAGNFTPNLMGFANGGIVSGGFKAFANGGVVSGPTLGLIGEGKYNEAVVPLPNGKSIPVQFSGERSARDMMSRNAQAAAQASPINLSFETTKIGNTEYVSRDQLEAAMAETRRAAINGGAARGMSMTLDRIQQSPSVRSRIGIR